MNKWRKRFKRQRRIAKTWIDWGDKKEAECNTALRKVAELRQDVLRAHTELARVQGVCDDTQAQVLKHSATIVNLRERENEALKESEGLLAWQRRVRNEWAQLYPNLLIGVLVERMNQAIEAEPTFDFTAYMRRAEYWGQTYDDTAEPKEEKL